MPHLLIIGGSDAGIMAGLRARELSPATEVTVVVADRFPNFSICGLPFFLSGEVTDWRNLAHRTVSDIEREGVRLLLEHTVTAVRTSRKAVTIRSAGGDQELSYDSLILATGAVSSRPRIPGLEHPGVFLLRWMDDAFAFHRHLTERPPRQIVIVGGGYIGLEMADAMSHRGIKVIVLEFMPTVMSTVDSSLGELLRSQLQARGVEVHTGTAVEAIEQMDGMLSIRTARGAFAADMALIGVGAAPRTDLANSAGLETGTKGAFKVNRKMETTVPHIFAAGDCVDTWHRVLNRYTYLPLGTTAHKQGRIAGENAVGGEREFAGSLGTQVVKVFDLVVARTGLNDAEARQAGLDPLIVGEKVWDHKVYYPGAKQLHIQICGDRRTGKLLGAQVAGHIDTEVSKRVDIFATAIFHDMLVEDLNDLDLSYTPPLSAPWDAVQAVAQTWNRTARQSTGENKQLAAC